MKNNFIFCALALTIFAYSGTARASMTTAEIDALIPTVIAAESSGRAGAVGDQGRARGLMQIQRAAWESHSREPWNAAFDGPKNVACGRAILRGIAAKYGARATPARILFTYNTGRMCDVIPAWAKRHKNLIYRKIFINE